MVKVTDYFNREIEIDPEQVQEVHLYIENTDYGHTFTMDITMSNQKYLVLKLCPKYSFDEASKAVADIAYLCETVGADKLMYVRSRDIYVQLSDMKEVGSTLHFKKM